MALVIDTGHRVRPTITQMTRVPSSTSSPNAALAGDPA